MNLSSCSNCGVVLDKDILPFPEDIYTEDYIIDIEKASWNGDTYVPFAPCPVCGSQILK